MANTEQVPFTRAQVVTALHSFVLTLIAVALTTLQLKQGNPFKKHYGTMVAFLVAVCVYVVAGLSIVMSDDLAEELTTVSLLPGLLASMLLILAMVPLLGWLCLVLWALFAVIIAHNVMSKRRPPQPMQQNNQNQDQDQDHVTLQMAQLGQEPDCLNTEEEDVYNELLGLC